MNSFSLAQDQRLSKVDSLLNLMASAQDSSKFDLIIILMRERLKENLYDEALRLSTEGEKIAESIGDSLRIVKIKYARGFILRKKDLTNQAISELKEAQLIASRNKFDSDLIKILNTLAIAYTFNGSQDKALECHFKALVIHEKKGANEDLAITYNNIGFIYFRLEDYQLALDYYGKSLEINTLLKNNSELDGVLINMALCYNKLGKFKESENFIRRALSICANDCEPIILMEAEYCLGVSLFEQIRQNEAIKHFELSLKLSKELNEKRFQIENLRYIAMFKQANGQSSDAIQVLNEAESIATNTDYLLNLIDLFTVFSSVYSDLKDFKKVAEYQKKYINLKDSVYSKELIKNLAKVQTNFAERENIKTIKEKNEVLVLKDKLLKKQRELSAVIVAVTLIVLTFAFVLIIFQRKYSKQLKEVNLKLEEKVLERTQDLKKTNEKLDRAQGDLRNFLYKTSHDIRGPVATLKGLNNLGFDNINDHVFSKELLEKKSTQIEKMIRTLSRITVVADITNTILQAVEINFVKMMDEIKDFERKNGLLKYIKISIEVEPNLKVVSDPILIRMILENMVDNSLKFFNESKRIEPYVKISVKSAGSDAIIVVKDNGVGIEVKPNQDVFTMFMRGSEKSETGGVGLYLCKICTDRLQGSIKLEKTSKAGTIFSIRISQDATDQVMELNEALLAQLRKEEPPIIEFDQETNN
jgi:signal transduction histidine kinase/Tfp pilus assembly protein PilF